MTDPRTATAVFTPGDLQALGRAFEDTLSTIAEGAFDHLPPRTLRRAVASGIVAEARRGERDPERLREAALASLAGEGRPD